jgi:hypothetical protein
LHWSVPRELLWATIAALLIIVFGFSHALLKHAPYAPAINSEQQANSGLQAKQGNDAKADTADHSPSRLPIVGGKGGGGESQPKAEHGEQEGTEFWPPFLGYRLKVTDTLVAAFTALLFFATIALWLSTRSLVQGAEITAKRQLRPYLLISPATLRNFSPNHEVFFGFNQINTGVTPAYGAIQNGAILILNYPLPENYPFPDLPKREHHSRTILTPRLPITGNVTADGHFTPAQLIEALKAPAQGKRLYIFGQIDYTDAFKDKHWHRFCYTLARREEWVPLAEAGNWDAINTFLSNPNIGISFETASQHNETDEG